MNEPQSPRDIAASLPDVWSPRVIGELDDNYIKVARIQGVFGWHDHAHEDEMFFILQGHLRIEMETGAVELPAGAMFVARSSSLYASSSARSSADKRRAPRIKSSAARGGSSSMSSASFVSISTIARRRPPLLRSR